MAGTFLVTPENWFDLGRIAASTDLPAPTEPSMIGDDGSAPLADLRLDELRAVHQTFSKWSSAERGDAYERCLPRLRELLKQKAMFALSGAGGASNETVATLCFPALEHPILSNPKEAIEFLGSFFQVSHSPSLVGWARTLLARPDLAADSRTRPWLRLLIQKIASEEEMPEALTCLRTIYGGPIADRRKLLEEEAQLLAECGLSDLAVWSRSLGIDRPARTQVVFERPRRIDASGTQPDIAVLIPSYCHANYIEATLDSVLAQTYSNHRVLVVDDRSTDGTVERASGTGDARVQVRVNDTNLGLGDSILRALETIDTPYVALLNSDDLFHPSRLERCKQVLDSSPKAQLVATGFAVIDAVGCRLTSDNVSRLFDGRRIADWIHWFSSAGQVSGSVDLLAELLERNFLITSSNVVCRTGFLRSHDEALRGLKYCFDWQLFLEAAAQGSLVYLKDELLGYRLHESNTVWFDEDRQTAYAMEVNRVLAHTLRRAHQAERARGVEHTTRLVDLVGHAARHSAANGLTLFATELVGGQALESARERSTAAKQSLRAMSESSVVVSTGPTGTQAQSLPHAAWALSDAVHAEAEAAWRAEGRAREELSGAQAEWHRTGVEQQRLTTDLERSEAERRRLTADLKRSEEERHRMTSALHGAATERDRLAMDLERALTEEQRQALATRRQVEAALQQAESMQQRSEAELRRRLADVEASLAAQSQAHSHELTRLRSTPEWVVGNTLWNRAGLSRVAGPTRRAMHRLVDRRNRWSLAAGRAARRAGLRKPRAVVAACWHFPIHSQTFVYQEMQGLGWAGFDCKVFCCDTNPKSELPAAFASLWPKRVVLQSDWALNRRDLEHFQRTRPERVEGLLEKLGDATGLTREALLNESIVMMGFTFARHVELAGAQYLHTYFFYDQSFLALMAAYLLQLPRGVTAYADHMLADYAFKLVPLHLELADIVVATSHRIKSELVAMDGERFADKIIVKPNGVDTSRFPYVDPHERLNGGEPELISVSRIEPKKGLIYLVEAMAVLRERGVNVRLNIVGGADQNTPTSADYFALLTATIDQLRLGDRVVLHGTMQQPDFVPLLRRSRIFVAPYVEVASGDKDGIPTAVLEAMSTGLPIVATDAGSIAEAVTDGVEALGVAQRDAGALADAIQRLVDDRMMYVRMAEAGRQRAVSEFDARVTEARLHERIKACLMQEGTDQ